MSMGKAVSALLIGAVVLATIPLRAQETPRAREFVLRGIGAGMNCVAWTELASSRDSLFSPRRRAQAQEVVTWAIGYISGAARYGDGLDPLKRSDVEQTVAWLDGHCARHPQALLNTALDAFVTAHSAR